MQKSLNNPYTRMYKKRTKNWNHEQRKFLYELCRKDYRIIENDRLNADLKVVKNKAWLIIYQKFSNKFGVDRHTDNLKEQWHKMKASAASEILEYNDRLARFGPDVAAWKKPSPFTFEMWNFMIESKNACKSEELDSIEYLKIPLSLEENFEYLENDQGNEEDVKMDDGNAPQPADKCAIAIKEETINETYNGNVTYNGTNGVVGGGIGGSGDIIPSDDSLNTSYPQNLHIQIPSHDLNRCSIHSPTNLSTSTEQIYALPSAPVFTTQGCNNLPELQPEFNMNKVSDTLEVLKSLRPGQFPSAPAATEKTLQDNFTANPYQQQQQASHHQQQQQQHHRNDDDDLATQAIKPLNFSTNNATPMAGGELDLSDPQQKISANAIIANTGDSKVYSGGEVKNISGKLKGLNAQRSGKFPSATAGATTTLKKYFATHCPQQQQQQQVTQLQQHHLNVDANLAKPVIRPRSFSICNAADSSASMMGGELDLSDPQQQQQQQVTQLQQPQQYYLNVDGNLAKPVIRPRSFSICNAGGSSTSMVGGELHLSDPQQQQQQQVTQLQQQQQPQQHYLNVDGSLAKPVIRPRSFSICNAAGSSTSIVGGELDLSDPQHNSSGNSIAANASHLIGYSGGEMINIAVTLDALNAQRSGELPAAPAVAAPALQNNFAAHQHQQQHQIQHQQQQVSQFQQQQLHHQNDDDDLATPEKRARNTSISNAEGSTIPMVSVELDPQQSMNANSIIPNACHSKAHSGGERSPDTAVFMEMQIKEHLMRMCILEVQLKSAKSNHAMAEINKSLALQKLQDYSTKRLNT